MCVYARKNSTWAPWAFLSLPVTYHGENLSRSLGLRSLGSHWRVSSAVVLSLDWPFKYPGCSKQPHSQTAPHTNYIGILEGDTPHSTFQSCPGASNGSCEPLIQCQVGPWPWTAMITPEEGKETVSTVLFFLFNSGWPPSHHPHCPPLPLSPPTPSQSILSGPPCITLHTSCRKHSFATPVPNHLFPSWTPYKLVFYDSALNYSPVHPLVSSSRPDAMHLVGKDHIFSFFCTCLR